MYQRTYRATEKGKEATRRQSQKPLRRLSNSLHKMATKTHPGPVSIPSLGVFADDNDVRDHFESTFEDWMSWQNIGPHRVGTDYDKVWQIGHRIPRALFDGGILEDRKRCFHRMNLFAQCARANCENRHTNVLTRNELIMLRPVWPMAAENNIEKLLAMYPKHDLNDVVDDSDAASAAECDSD